MNKFVSIIGLSVFLLIVSACSPMYETTYTFTPPHTDQGRMCVAQCQQSKNLCRRLCHVDMESCRRNAREEARFRYEEYVTERHRRGEPIQHDLSFYYNPSMCVQKTCSCKEDYRSCYQMCGGELHPHRHCVAFCGD